MTEVGLGADLGAEVDVAAVGRVVDEGRGSLPFALLHGEALVTCATWALEAAGVELLDARGSVADLDAGPAVVLHDALCPMTPPDFIARCAERASHDGTVVVGVRPVTDTVKELHGDLVGETVDRESLARVCSPLVVPPGWVSQLADVLDDAGIDLASAVGSLRERGIPVELAEAPPEAARVRDADDLRVLEALTRHP